MLRRLGLLLPAVLLALPACATVGDDAVPLTREAAPPVTTTTAPPPPDTTEPPIPATTAPPTTEAAAPPPPDATAASAPGRDTTVYNGLGAWIDVYDWSATYGKDGPLVTVADIDRMADLGVQTLYVQASKWDSPTDVLEPEHLLPLIERAHERGLAVVAWYLPTFEDPATDLRRLLAIAALPVEGLAVDIESRKVDDPAERTRRLLALSADLRAALPDTTLGAIPYPPVILEVLNPGLWPGFPWVELDALYDVWLPMSYQSYRTPGSPYRDAYTYTAENIDRIRSNVGRPDAAIHHIGGIADRTSGDDVRGMLQACVERGCLGGSLYDYRTTYPELWPYLLPFRAGNR